MKLERERERETMKAIICWFLRERHVIIVRPNNLFPQNALAIKVSRVFFESSKLRHKLSIKRWELYRHPIKINFWIYDRSYISRPHSFISYLRRLIERTYGSSYWEIDSLTFLWCFCFGSQHMRKIKSAKQNSSLFEFLID